MQQVLFTIPFLKWLFPPDGVPVYGFGAMLFITFLLVTLWGSVRAKAIGMPPVRFQDFAIWVFICGLIGARLLYMIQYANQFPNKNVLALVGAFFKIWEGGLIFYGSALGGAIGYGLFYWFIMRRLQVSGWQLADAVAPLVAMGLAIGRIGCYLNGCCWGQVCDPEAIVPLGPAHFPLLPAHARGQLVADQYLQSSTGFAERSNPRVNLSVDPRAEVTAVESGSPAAAAGVRAGDRVVKVNGKPNSIVVELVGANDQIELAVKEMKEFGGRARSSVDGRARVEFDSPEAYFKGELAAQLKTQGLRFLPIDSLEEQAREWPRGKGDIALGVERDGQEIDLPAFTPRTVGLYPTQLYETVSMVLLIFVLLAYYPFRSHDGELMVVLMIGYAVHRFINESLRIEPVVGMGLTLSQWGSVVIFAAAIVMEILLWRLTPSLWKHPPASGQTTETPPVVPPVVPAAVVGARQ